jgi:hypothetical protein
MIKGPSNKVAELVRIQAILKFYNFSYISLAIPVLRGGRRFGLPRSRGPGFDAILAEKVLVRRGFEGLLTRSSIAVRQVAKTQRYAGRRRSGGVEIRGDSRFVRP